MSEQDPTPDQDAFDGIVEAELIDVDLTAELEAARNEAASHLDDLKRLAADYDNFRRRSAKENEALLDRATERVVHRLMPVLDSFDAALGVEPRTETERQLFSGMVNTREQLLKALEAEGLELIPTVGEPFNPEFHEPIGAPEGSGNLVVASELRRGYLLREKVLRAALVTLEVD